MPYMLRALLSLVALTMACDSTPDTPTTPSATTLETASGEREPEPAADETEAGTVTTTTYWPPGFFSEDNDGLDRHMRGWYGRHLAAMGEPSLYEAREDDVEAYRFIHLPTWGRPVVVRIEKRGSTVRMTHRILSGQGGYDPGELTTDTTTAATEAQLDSVRDAIDEADFWDLPVTADLGMDGEQWIIEAARDGRYHLVDRWTPAPDGDHAEFVAACAALQALVATE